MFIMTSTKRGKPAKTSSIAEIYTRELTYDSCIPTIPIVSEQVLVNVVMVSRTDERAKPGLREAWRTSRGPTGHNRGSTKLSTLPVHTKPRRPHDTIRYDTIGEFNVDWKAEYSAYLAHVARKRN